MNTNENITLVENNNIISSEIDIAEKLNAFFSNIVEELNIKVKKDLLCDVSDINDPVGRAIQEYKNNPSIQMIKETFDSIKYFHLTLLHLASFLRKYYLLILKKLHTLMMYQPKLLK